MLFYIQYTLLVVTDLSRLGFKRSCGPSARLLYKEISRRLVDTSRDQRAGSFFGQRINIAIQRGNAASLLGTFPDDSDVVEYFGA